MSTGYKVRKIHILVATAVAPVHQAGFGGGVDFVDQRSHSAFCNIFRIKLKKILRKHLVGNRLQLLHGMHAPCSAGAPGGAANKATTQCATLQFLAGYIHNVHVKQPPEGMGFFNLNAKLFQVCGICLHGKHGSIAGFVGIKGVMYQGFLRKALLQSIDTSTKTPLNQRGVFYGTCNIHSEADQGITVLLQQLLLQKYSLLPGL